ncbi:MAG: pyruvate, phosphate dikinase, partial [Candidatus Tectomicrobia bacterium]|nr:pyruvate, phosphate dikinase [Candidatus Tectomicrobia bacterium]
MSAKKYVYLFAEGRGEWKELLGGKGAGLAEMTSLGILVPAGFTISTEACTEFYRLGGKYPEEMWEQVHEALHQVEKVMGAKFGDPANPLLVSVRSGARVSMPGMMDTVLNLGLNEDTLQGLVRKTHNPRFAYDAYRRFLTMFGNVVMGVPHSKFEEILEARKHELGVHLDTELDAEALRWLIHPFKALVRQECGRDFPDDPLEQLKMGIDAVFYSWNVPRAIAYRNIHKIPEDWGTAVNVQAMVFGNMGDNSGTGVAFTRDPATGEKRFFGEFLANAQGEDVVAGIRTPLPISDMEQRFPEAYRELVEIYQKLETHYKEMLDLEFTVQEGKLYMLQTRTGKRTGFAAFRIAVDMVEEGLIPKEEALMRLEPEQLNQLLRPVFHAGEKERAITEGRLLAKGLNAGPGAACGKVVFHSEDAEAWSKREKVILVRIETSPEDIKGMNAAEGILTSRGGLTSHAALVARQMGKVCVAGCGELEIDYDRRQIHVNGKIIKEGDFLSVDGTTGEVIQGTVQTVPSEILQVLLEKTMRPDESVIYQKYLKMMTWANEVRKLGIRSNADQPDQAAIARAFGAEGIGLCRTEHMFFGGDRITAVREMILAEDEGDRKKALAKLLPMQREDFIGIFKAMNGYPVTIRTLDPPLHEFLPREDEEIEVIARDLNIPFESIKAKVESLVETNPMLGHRGCRLGITYPEITEMQSRAIFEAACEVAKPGIKVIPEIMIPLVGHVNELKLQEEVVRRVAREVMQEQGIEIEYAVGTMIELPRAALTADQIAQIAEFFSFGTNDLTQTTFGLSRDDAGRFLPEYVSQKIVPDDPFITIDQEGVG